MYVASIDNWLQLGAASSHYIFWPQNNPSGNGPACLTERDMLVYNTPEGAECDDESHNLDGEDQGRDHHVTDSVVE